MAKNLVVCADGTGNEGGYTPDSNVYRVYKSIDKHFKGRGPGGFKSDEQMVFYDNGVGTAKNKYLRALGGAFGFGFEQNVCDLYEFLARNYEPGDRIYFFGFSRGASTVRACNGFIAKCGLIKGKGLRNGELKALVSEAFEAYKLNKVLPEAAEKMRDSARTHGVVPIHFMGIWDTVVALGFPKRTDVTGTVTQGLNWLFGKMETWLDKRWPHSFYHYRLTENVEHACQALAIDDVRTAFWPFVWREQVLDEAAVEQVWFAGMHSNVGGGYERSGLASVPLYWMMLRAQKFGLKFEDGALQQALDDSNAHGRLYDSRDGAAIMYRYHPREIEKLCAGRLHGQIRLHRSVIERMNHRTANYAPGQLPGEFVVSEDAPDADVERRNPGKHPEWDNIRKRINACVDKRKGLYDSMVTFVAALLVAGLLSWLFVDVEVDERSGPLGYIADCLDYVVPGFLENLVHLVVYEYWYVMFGLLWLAYYYLSLRAKFHLETTEACEALRHLVIHEQSQQAGDEADNPEAVSEANP